MSNHLLVVSWSAAVLLCCGGPGPSWAPDAPSARGGRGALTACDVPLPEGFVRLLASEGVAFEVAGGVAAARGEGCDLSMRTPVAAGELVDVGAQGELYVHASREFLERALPGEGLDAIVRLQDGQAPAVVARGGRGIARFGVSLTGRSYWMQGVCGGLGVYSMGVEAPRFLVEIAPTPSALAQADDEHLWVIAQQCDTSRCTAALVRSGPTKTARWTWPDAGSRLARCHADICVVTDERVTRVAADGAVAREETLATLGAQPGERIEAVTASRAGLYVTLAGPTGARVRFVP